MSALDWQKQMTHAPRLVHDADGLVLVQLGEHSVVFPTEVDARFFHAAYAAVPNLTSEVASLRASGDEGALLAAQARGDALEVEVEVLKRERTDLLAQNASLGEKAAAAVTRAKLLAHALKRQAKL